MELDPNCYSLFSDDKVQDFLLEKLQGMKVQNEESQAVLEEHRQALVVDGASDLQLDFKFENIWKKFYSSVFFVGFEVVASKPLKAEWVRVQCNGWNELSYHSQSYTVGSNNTICNAGTKCNDVICDLLKESTECGYRAWVVVKIFRFSFKMSLSYNLLMTVFCKINGEKIWLPAPPITLSIEDTRFSKQLLAEPNSLPNLFTLIEYNSLYEPLVLSIPPDWTTPLSITFEVNCGLTYLPFGKSGYFITKDISSSIDGAVIIVHPHKFQPGDHNILLVKTYSSSRVQFVAILHHFLTCIPRSIILPLEFYESLGELKFKGYREYYSNGNWSDLEESYRDLL